MLGHWGSKRTVRNQGCSHGVAWFLSLLAVSASLFSFDLQSNILASLFIYLFIWHFILLIDFPFVYPYVNLALNFQLN